jgi:hypothetical protein
MGLEAGAFDDEQEAVSGLSSPTFAFPGLDRPSQHIITTTCIVRGYLTRSADPILMPQGSIRNPAVSKVTWLFPSDLPILPLDTCLSCANVNLLTVPISSRRSLFLSR